MQPDQEETMTPTERQHDDVSVATDRFVSLSTSGGAPVLKLRPEVVPEMEFEGERFPEERAVRITFPDGRSGSYRPEAIQAALEAVEHLRSES